MATIKAYTDLEQSKKLAEILPLESADMYHFIDDIDKVYEVGFGYRRITADYYSKIKLEYIPCWSLAKLLDILKDKITFGGSSDKNWFVAYTVKTPRKLLTIYESDLVDACVAMIEQLYKLKIL